MVVPEGITTVDNQWIWGSYRLAFIDLPSTLTRIVGYGLSPHQGSSYQVNYNVIIRAATPPTVDSTLSNYTQKLIAIYVPNESVVTYRETSIWSSLKSKIHGFFDMPPIIIKDGTYTMTLRNIFENYSDLQVSMMENDYLTLSVEDDVMTITASGITSSTDTTVAISYSFTYRGSTISGTINLLVLYKEIIEFEDAEAKRICVANWGGEYRASTNKYGMKGEIIAEQAAVVSSISTTTFFKSVSSFEEIRYFTNLKTITGFKSNTKMTTITLPEGVTTLGTECFRLSSIKYLVLPSTITALGSECLNPVNNCSYIVFKSTNPPSLNANAFNLPSSCRIYVPDAWVPIYKESRGWINYSSRIYSISQLAADRPDAPAIADLREEGFLPYIDFKDAEVKRICCLNWGDYTEAVKTETVTEESATVSISTAYTYVHKVNTTATRTALKTLTSSRAKTESDVVGTTTTTTNYPVGMTNEQVEAVSSLRILRDSGLSFDAYCNYFPQSMDNYGYVTENMVVHFDGIDKGGDSSAWTDIISGTLKFPYSEHSAIESNCIHMDGQGSLVASSFVPSRYQFEICAKNINSGTGAIYCSGRQDDNCCIVQSDGFYTCPSGWGNIVWKVNPRPDTIVMSHCGNNKPKMLNGVIYPGTTVYKGYDVNNNITTLGGRNNSDYIECMVYSIRIYSRQLTESEMIHNQRVDNERFNMGLTFQS